MKHILVLGAGKSAPYLIRNLLEQAVERDWFVTVGDVDADLARKRVAGHPRGDGIAFDVTDTSLRETRIEKSDVVVNFLSPRFQYLVALDCVKHGAHMVSASYQNPDLVDLDADANRAGVVLLNEMGLDPGIDHMSAMALIERIRTAGGVIEGFYSYGAGVAAPSKTMNPLRYVITWNPRNVVMSGAAGAQYLENGKIKIVPHHQVFHHTWDVEVDGVGLLEAYPNRDSLTYLDTFGLGDVRTMIRGTLRFPGWSETWSVIVRLGLPNETIPIPKLQERTYAEVVEMFLPLAVTGATIEKRLARFLQISPTGRIMENLRWLGLFSTEKVRATGSTAAAMLQELLERKLPLEPNARDLVILQHVIDVRWPSDGDRTDRHVATMVEYGEPRGMTAMARTVGLPAAIGVKRVLSGELTQTGCQIPTHPAIYEPILAELEAAGIRFTEKTVERPSS